MWFGSLDKLLTRALNLIPSQLKWLDQQSLDTILELLLGGLAYSFHIQSRVGVMVPNGGWPSQQTWWHLKTLEETKPCPQMYSNITKILNVLLNVTSAGHWKGKLVTEIHKECIQENHGGGTIQYLGIVIRAQRYWVSHWEDCGHVCKKTSPKDVIHESPFWLLQFHQTITVMSHINFVIWMLVTVAVYVGTIDLWSLCHLVN